jgi:hypothetical protein
VPRPHFEVADVFRRYGEQFLQQYGASVSLAQRRVLDQVVACRTWALGGHVKQCDACDATFILYDSCRNRHCPKCLGAASAEWLEDRRSELLPVPYFHVVFTLPACLRPVVLQNKAVLYDLLFRAASETLTEIAADPEHLGARIGVLAILHTWGQNLLDHPHLHCIVPGGGISPGRDRWVACRPGFFLPVRVLSRLFRGKLLAFLRAAFEAGRLQFHGSIESLRDRDEFQKLLDSIRRKEAVVHAKPPFGGPEQVLKYLARYTHRVAISNRRLLAIDDGKVTFRWKDYALDSRHRKMTLDATEFIRRFLLHVFPKGFVRIRYYGFFANRCRKANLGLCRALLGNPEHVAVDTRTLAASGDDEPDHELRDNAAAGDRASRPRCPACATGRLFRLCTLRPFETFQPRSTAGATTPT